jgi:ribosomal protein S18 acetylase RimI-like enzyme
MTIEKPKREDYKEIAELTNEAEKRFLDIYTKEMAVMMEVCTESEEKLIDGEKTREYLCVKDNGKIVSFASFHLKNPQTIWISSLYTHPQYQGKGYGRALDKEIEKIAKEQGARVIVLETEKQADWAVNFYLKNGYSILSDEDLKKFPFDQVLNKPQVPNRYILGKVVDKISISMV